MREILTLPNPVLRQKALPIVDFGEKTQKLIAEMMKILKKDPNGVGLAAPQIGESLRLILVTEKTKKDKRIIPLLNPEITFSSKETKEDYEGCLSLPFKVGLITRSTKIKVTAQNESGQRLHLRAAGFLAREIQHEVDHLDGILFPDRTTPDMVFDFTVDADGRWVIQKTGSEEMKVRL
jgi:peptide deformylase